MHHASLITHASHAYASCIIFSSSVKKKFLPRGSTYEVPVHLTVIFAQGDKTRIDWSTAERGSPAWNWINRFSFLTSSRLVTFEFYCMSKAFHIHVTCLLIMILSHIWHFTAQLLFSTLGFNCSNEKLLGSTLAWSLWNTPRQAHKKSMTTIETWFWIATLN